MIVNPLAYTLCYMAGSVDVRTRQEDSELIAAVSERLLAASNRTCDQSGDLPQQVVAGAMAEDVVEHLERVKVKHEE
jgi:hypothetical protein